MYAFLQDTALLCGVLHSSDVESFSRCLLLFRSLFLQGVKTFFMYDVNIYMNKILIPNTVTSRCRFGNLPALSRTHGFTRLFKLLMVSALFMFCVTCVCCVNCTPYIVAQNQIHLSFSLIISFTPQG